MNYFQRLHEIHPNKQMVILRLPTILFLLALFYLISCESKDQQSSQKTDEQIVVSQPQVSIEPGQKKYVVEKIENLLEISIEESSLSLLITYPKLKSSLYYWLFYNTRAKEKKRDYGGMYSILSAHYLKKHFPDIKSSAEYKADMEERDHIHYLEYFSIESIKILNNNTAKIGVTLKSADEGVIYEQKESIDFILEGDTWKYDII